MLKDIGALDPFCFEHFAKIDISRSLGIICPDYYLLRKIIDNGS